jgi:hypothetical protein
MAHGLPVHRIGSRFAHVPQALTPRFPTDERNDVRSGPQPATLADSSPPAGAQPVATASRATAAGRPFAAAAQPQPRAPPAVHDA